MGRFCLQHLWIDGRTAGKVLLRGQSGVPLMVWKEKQGRVGGGWSYLSSSSWAECCFWNFLSGIIRGADFFDFLWLCLLYMNCFCGTRRLPRPPLFSLSWICLISHRQNGGSWPSCINSESLRGWGLDSEGRRRCEEGLFWGAFLCFLLCSGLVFLPERCILLPSGRCWECLWSSRESLPTPLSSQKCPPTPQTNIQFGFFQSTPHLNQSHSPSLLEDPTTFPHHLWWTTVCTAWIGFTNGPKEWRNSLAGFIWKKGCNKDNMDVEWIWIISIIIRIAKKNKHRGLLKSVIKVRISSTCSSAVTQHK